MDKLRAITRSLPVALIAAVVLQGCSLQEEGSDALLKQGADYVTAGQFKQAEEQFTRVMQTDDDKHFQLYAMLELAKCYLHEKNFSEALQICARAHSVAEAIYGRDDSINLSILFMTAAAQSGLQQYDAAVETCKMALSLSEKLPDHSAAKTFITLRLAEITAKKGDLNEAIRLYKSIKPIGPFLSLRLAACLAAAGKKNEAERIYQSNLPRESEADYVSKCAVVFDAYAQFLKRNGDEDGAKKIEKNKAVWSQNADSYYSWLSKRFAKNSKFTRMRSLAQADLLDAFSE